MKKMLNLFSMFMTVSLLLSACARANTLPEPGDTDNTGPTGKLIEYKFTSGLENGQMQFVGVGGDIDGQVNPPLSANTGDTFSV